MVDAPNPPYLGPAAHDSGAGNMPLTRVVMHCTVSPCRPGGARDIAAYFRSPNSGGSAHYIVDPGDTVQVVYDSRIAWHAPPNSHSIGVELCDPMSGSGARWNDADHQAMLKRAAKLVAQLCLAYDVPIRRLDVADLKAGRKGICGHADVSDAFKQSSHWDPGPAFPWEQFMRYVRREAERFTAQPVPDPTPVDKRKERAKPTRITRARRLLRKALSKTDRTHERYDQIQAAIRELPKR